jgi:hypothetical protein
MDDTETWEKAASATPKKKKHKPVGVAARAVAFPSHFAYTQTALAFLSAL